MSSDQTAECPTRLLLLVHGDASRSNVDEQQETSDDGWKRQHDPGLSR